MERPPRPGELCTCGRTAITVFVTEEKGDVPYCGIPDGGANREDLDDEDLDDEDLDDEDA